MKMFFRIILAVLLIELKSYAISLTDFSLEKTVFPKNTEAIKVTFNTSGIYKIRCVSEGAHAQIYNQETKLWVGQNELWSSNPTMQSIMQIRFLTKTPKIVFWFEIQNIQTGTVESSAKQTIWFSDDPKTYIERLVLKQATPVQETTQSPPQQKVNYNLLAGAVALTIVSIGSVATLKWIK